MKGVEEAGNKGWEGGLLPQFWPPQGGPGAIIVLLERDLLGVSAARSRVSFLRCRLERNVAHAGKNGSPCNAREKAGIRSWGRRRIWLCPGHGSILATITDQTRPGSITLQLLSQHTPHASIRTPEQL